MENERKQHGNVVLWQIRITLVHNISQLKARETVKHNVHVFTVIYMRKKRTFTSNRQTHEMIQVLHFIILGANFPFFFLSLSLSSSSIF